MDYSGFAEFPFPSDLPAQDYGLRDFFFSLSDDEQLGLLNGCTSYGQFHDRLFQRYDYSHTI